MSQLPVTDLHLVLQNRHQLAQVSRIIRDWLRRFGVSPQDCEDANQAVLLAVHKNLSTLDPERSYWPWLKTVTFRIAQDHRRLARHGREILDSAAAALLVSNEPTVETRLIAFETAQALRTALTTLKAPRREVLVLRTYEDLPMHEIAAIQGIPVMRAHTRLRLARADMRKAWRRRKEPEDGRTVGWRTAHVQV